MCVTLLLNVSFYTKCVVFLPTQDLVREKFALQCAMNENLVQMSSLRNQLDEMRHRRGERGVEPSTLERQLEAERERCEEKDKQVGH